MLKKAFLLLSASTLVGCVNTATVKLDTSHSSALVGKSLVVATSDNPDFLAMTPGKAMFAVVGTLAMYSAGNDLVKEHSVEDPAVYIGSQLANVMANAQGIKPVAGVFSSNNNAVKDQLQAHSGYDYVLDVRTGYWALTYFPTDWERYRVLYNVKARLIDVANEKVIAEAFCARVPKEQGDSPKTYDQLINRNAAGLKAELRAAGDFCLQDLSNKLF
ncbi:MAG: hypothetical protein ACPGMR_12730 [Pontibacterium sp.]